MRFIRNRELVGHPYHNPSLAPRMLKRPAETPEQQESERERLAYKQQRVHVAMAEHRSEREELQARGYAF